MCDDNHSIPFIPTISPRGQCLNLRGGLRWEIFLLSVGGRCSVNWRVKLEGVAPSAPIVNLSLISIDAKFLSVLAKW